MSGGSQIKSGVTWHIQDIMYPRTSQFLPPSTILASCGCERLRCTLLACRGCCCRRWATKVFSCGKTRNEKHQEHLHERLISKRNVGKYTSPIHWSNQIITTKQPESDSPTWLHGSYQSWSIHQNHPCLTSGGTSRLWFHQAFPVLFWKNRHKTLKQNVFF